MANQFQSITTRSIKLLAIVPTALLRPFRGGAVSHNGVVLYREAVLKPGDLIGIGNHFVFLYRDPRVTPPPPIALALALQADGMISFGPGNITDRQEALRKYLGSSEAVLKFQANHADVLLQVQKSVYLLILVTALCVFSQLGMTGDKYKNIIHINALSFSHYY